MFLIRTSYYSSFRSTLIINQEFPPESSLVLETHHQKSYYGVSTYYVCEIRAATTVRRRTRVYPGVPLRTPKWYLLKIEHSNTVLNEQSPEYRHEHSTSYRLN